MKRLFEMTRQEILTKGKNEDPAKFARRLNYVNSIKPMSIAKDLFIKTGTLTVPISVGDYTVTIHVSKIMKLIRKELDKANRILPDRAIVYSALRQAVDTCELQVDCTCPDFCLHEDTMIKLLSGEVIKVSELKQKFDNGEELWAYSTDEKGDFRPGKIEDVWITKYTSDFIKVTLDNGEVILTTPNHEYMMRDGSYTEAQELHVGQSLMPLYFKYFKGYEQVKLNSTTKSWVSVYKIVARDTLAPEIEEAFSRSDEDIIAIHHSDFNKLNNNPSNLKPMGKLEHWNYHSSLMKGKWKDPLFREKAIFDFQKGNRERWSGEHNEENREYLSSIKSRWWNSLSKEEHETYIRKHRELHRSEEQRVKHSIAKKKWWSCITEEEKQEIIKKCDFGNAYNNLTEAEKRSRDLKVSIAHKKRWSSMPEEERRLKTTQIREMGKKPKTQNHKEGIGLGQSEYWKNMTDEERVIRCEQQKNSPESIQKQVMSRYGGVLNKLLSSGLDITEENYNLQRKAGDPRVSKHFMSFNDLLEYFDVTKAYNHKIVKIEKITYNNDVPVYDISIKDQHNFLVGAGVILHNCYRHAYWATKNNYKYGDPERRPSNITNPNNTGAVCKHTTAALVRPSQWLKYVSGWISTVVRAYLQNKLGIDAEDTGDLVDPEDAEDVKDEIESIQDLKSEKEEFEDSDVEVPAEDMETEEETEESPEKEEETSEEEK